MTELCCGRPFEPKVNGGSMRSAISGAGHAEQPLGGCAAATQISSFLNIRFRLWRYAKEPHFLLARSRVEIAARIPDVNHSSVDTSLLAPEISRPDNWLSVRNFSAPGALPTSTPFDLHGTRR